MGADRRVLAPQLAAFPNLVVPAWIKRYPGETLSDYGARFAGVVDPSVPCFIGGVSFGSAVAMEMAPHLRAIAVFIIGGLRGPEGLPWRVRMLRPAVSVMPEFLVRWMAHAAVLAFPVLKPVLGTAPRTLLEQFGASEPGFMGWAGRALLGWRPASSRLTVPVHHVHGAADHILPARRSRAEVVVPGAGHVLSLTRAQAVNEFLRERMALYEGSRP